MKAYLFTIILIINFSQSQAANWQVCAECSCSQLSEAIEAASPGDTLTVDSGLYQEGRIIIGKSLVLRGNNYPRIDGKGESEVITITADHVSLVGFQIQNVGHSYLEDRAGIRVQKAKHFIIQNNRLINTFFGIYLEHAQYGLISHNFIEGQAIEEMSSGNAIHLWYSKHVEITDNEISGHRDGIYFEFVDNSQVRRNKSHHNLRYGLHFMFSNDDEYHQNIFRENGAGVAVMFSKKIRLTENQFIENWGRAAYGLLLKEIYDADIIDNHFEHNTLGIHVEGCSRILYKANTFLYNGWAMRVAGGCSKNEIKGNNFIDNTFDLSMNSQVGDNYFDGNYWSDYASYDLDRDGIGDVPHNPVKLFSYVVNQSPEAIMLLRSTFVDLLNFSEKVSPVFSPPGLEDQQPHIKPFSQNFKTYADDSASQDF
ncbi:MAG: nitrous oxide reductase family maturation protein NosD [Bacteroidetes bacterium]|nr:nitrous oxide reductase family maturation protein NosD [Bacteroidota bacterium]MCB0845264.1 nitrous oxide reductase family maturation protein NosD [Bacteroidota bacterium]